MTRIYTVGEVNRYIRNLITDSTVLAAISVRGEVSNCKYHSSGHIYFSIKDERSAISCVMFAGNRGGLGFRMKDGDKVVVSGRVDVYERDGRYQLYAIRIEPEGEGLLFEHFRLLKQKLEKEGLFDSAYKKPVPKYARTIGIVTAPTGAAVRDIQNIARRRNPYVQLILYPALVQGKGASQSISEGIRALDGSVDLIIIGRGGGSIEDLWAFNEEIVARTVFECETPVISAVGHETDTTISDFVADLRAPTPSAAAELAVFDLARFRNDLRMRRSRITEREKMILALKRSRFTALKEKLKNQAPGMRLLRMQHRMELLRHRFDGQMCHILNEDNQRLVFLTDRYIRAGFEKRRDTRLRWNSSYQRLCDAGNRLMDRNRQRYALVLTRYEGLSPLKRLEQGFSFVEFEDGTPLRSVKNASLGDRIKVRMKDGTIIASVEEIGEKGVAEYNE